MNKIHKKRLLKLAKHLRSGKLGHEKFDFCVVNGDEYRFELKSNGCGSLGCAIGECPFAFPRTWKFRKGQPNFIKKPARTGHLIASFEAAKSFFGLDWHEATHLFSPNSQNTYDFGGRDLDAGATAKQVAANIEAFVKRKERDSK